MQSRLNDSLLLTFFVVVDIEISERTEDSSIWLRGQILSQTFVLTHDMCLELIIVHMVITIKLQVDWLTNFD